MLAALEVLESEDIILMLEFAVKHNMASYFFSDEDTRENILRIYNVAYVMGHPDKFGGMR